METGWARVEQLGCCLPPGATFAVSMVNLTSGMTHEINGDVAYPAASTIKAAILVTLAQVVGEGGMQLADPLPARADLVVGGTGVLWAMAPGLTLSAADHAYLMTAISDNTASNVLIDAVGIPRIQQTLSTLGLTTMALNRFFLGRLPGPGEPENFVSANDLAALFAAIGRDEAAPPFTSGWLREVLAKQQFRDRLARWLPAGVSFAGKYGSVGPYAHDAGLLAGPRGTIAVAVLTSGFPDYYAADVFIGAIGQALAADLV